MTTNTLQLVEQHIIDKSDPRWAAIDATCFLSKNLYNAANYIVRQEYIFNHHYIPYLQLDKRMQRHPDYCALPRKVSQWVLRQVNLDWQAHFSARDEWEVHPERFLGRPKLPTYKDKTNGRNLLVYTAQAVGKRAFEEKGVLQPSQLGIVVETKQKTFNQVRVVPRKTHYVVEVVYTAPVQSADVDSNRVAAIDIGLDNLATVTSNQPDFRPLLINGRPLKAINQFYNKERARLQSQLNGEQKTSRRIDALTDKRNRRVNAYLHRASRHIIERLITCRIGMLVIGKNDGWKQKINLGNRTNQSFVQIPHARFIDMLIYKAERLGIKVIVTEENYTSKCSFLDNEPVGKHEVYAGRRVKRWLFVASNGKEIHADVNGSLNILRKVIPNAFEAGGIAASVVTPVRVTPH